MFFNKGVKTPFIININGMIFKTIVDAKKWAKKASKIIEVLHGTRKTAGRDPITNEKLKWEYVENKDN